MNKEQKLFIDICFIISLIFLFLLPFIVRSCIKEDKIRSCTSKCLEKYNCEYHGTAYIVGSYTECEDIDFDDAWNICREECENGKLSILSR